MLQVDTAPTLTIEQVDQRLPLVGRIARDLVGTWAKVLTTRSALEGAVRPGTTATEAQSELNRELANELDRMVQRVQGFLLEIRQLGGTFQEYRRGVVNFPIERDGRLVLACWVPGEDATRGWHETHETLAQRKPL